jgi:hypothetical protein
MSLTDIMSSMNLSLYPIIALIIFAFIFISVIVKTIRTGKVAEAHALLPFAEESQNRRNSGTN